MDSRSALEHDKGVKDESESGEASAWTLSGYMKVDPPLSGKMA